MASEMETIPLGELCVRITKGTTPTTLGRKFRSEGVNFVKSEAITSDGRIDSSTFAFIDADTHSALSRSILKEKDVLFSMAGVYLGKTAVVPGSILPANTNQAVGIIRADQNKANPIFIHYALSSPSIRSLVLRSVAQSAQPNFNLRDIGNLPIPKLPLRDQEAIANVLGVLDEKIELNRQMNKTLEDIARSLFKSWFVDFDPVRTRRDGRSTTLPDSVATLFPNHFQDSEIGDIPIGWNCRSVYDSAKFVNGLAFKTGSFSQERLGLPVIKIGELKSGITSQTKFTTDQFAPKYRVRSGDVLFSWSGSPDTSIDTFLWVGVDGWLNQHVFKLQFHETNHKVFVYHLLRFLKPAFVEIARNKQTTGLGHVTAEDLKRLKVCWPSEDVLNAFDRIATPLFGRAFACSEESISLAALRDCLQPRLLSGELRIPDAERIVGGQV